MADEVGNPLVKGVYGATIHESGHAVMACLLNINFDSVTVLCQGSSRGRLLVREEVVRGLNDTAFILTSLAGYIAEIVKFGEYDALGASSDRRKAVLRIRKLVQENSISEVLSRYESLTSEIIRTNIESVATLADKLLVHPNRTLQASEVHALVDPLLDRSSSTCLSGEE